MNNKENLWRLKDEEGKPVAKEPMLEEEEVAVYFNNEKLKLGRMQPMRARLVEVPSFETLSMGSFINDPFVNRPVIQTRTFEQEYPDILDLMMRENYRYESSFRQRPEYLSLSKEGYRSFYIEMRGRRDFTSGMNPERFMGLAVMCNPLQEKTVMALGRPEQEGIRGGLYHE